MPESGLILAQLPRQASPASSWVLQGTYRGQSIHGAYNLRMFEDLQASLGAAAMTRLTLLANHVLHGEATATERLRAHTGRCIAFELRRWPALLPPPAPLVFRITPAGLLEWCGDAPPAQIDLRAGIDASNPALLFVQGLAGERPNVDVQGDAALATDVSWLVENLRWDIEDDLERVLGPLPARQIARLAALFAQGLRSALHVIVGARPAK
jgi:ubiquinone biosynthesis protein UbiJ